MSSAEMHHPHLLILDAEPLVVGLDVDLIEIEEPLLVLPDTQILALHLQEMELLHLQNHLQDVQTMHLVGAVALIQLTEDLSIEDGLVLRVRRRRPFEEQHSLLNFVLHAVEGQMFARPAIGRMLAGGGREPAEGGLTAGGAEDRLHRNQIRDVQFYLACQIREKCLPNFFFL